MATIITPHERDILDRLANGEFIEDIAVDLGMTTSGISKALDRVYGKLGIRHTPYSRDARREAILQYMTGEALR